MTMFMGFKRFLLHLEEFIEEHDPSVRAANRQGAAAIVIGKLV